MQHLRISCIRCVALVIISKPLQCRQEILIEVLELIALLYKCLYQLQYISPDCFHGLDHGLILLVEEGLADALGVHGVHAQEVGEDLLKVAQVDVAYGLCHARVHFQDEVYRL